MKTALLVHGRHLQAVGWDRLAWGDIDSQRMGVLPKMIHVVLNIGIENVAGIFFGTGTSERNGKKESVYTKYFLQYHMQQLAKFDLIKGHPRFQSSRDLVLLDRLIDKIECDLETQNTDQEIESAARYFAGLDVKQVIQVTCGSHAPRSMLAQLKARHRGDIPNFQMWSVVGDDMTFAGSEIGDVAIIEPPHRGDDPMLDAEVAAHKIFPKYYRITGKGEKIAALQAIDSVFRDFIPKR